MSIFPRPQKRWWISFGATFWLALLTTVASNGESVPAAVPGKAASRVRVHALRSYGRSALFCRGRHAAHFARPLFGDPDDDQASDNPHDDDDAYEDIDVYDNTDVPTFGPQSAPVPFLAVPEVAPESWAEPSFAPFSTLERLRC
jgi:hypothetical protein